MLGGHRERIGLDDLDQPVFKDMDLDRPVTLVGMNVSQVVGQMTV